MSIQNFSDFDRISYNFRQNNKNAKELEKDLENYITSNTVNEKTQLENAMKNYENKVKQLMDSKQSELNQIDNYHEEMSSTLKKTFEAFQQTINSIKNNPDIPDDQKEQKINETADFIMNSLYTKDEIDEFKNYAENMVIVIPNNSLQYNQLTTPQLTNNAGADIQFY